MQIKINGIKVKHMVGSFNISDVIAERSIASFVIYGDLGTHYKKGQPVQIYDQFNTLIYAGVINNSSEVRESANNSRIIHTIQCQDWTYLADKRIIAKAYQNTTAGEIVQDIITNLLSIEGITSNIIQDGPIVTEAVFNYIPVSTALDSLAEKAGFWWNIDVNKKLSFTSRGTNFAPWSVTWSKLQVGSVSYQNSNPKYRNKQYIKGGKDITDPQTEVRKGDGNTKSFTLGFPIALVPTIKVNGIAKTIGIKSIDSGMDWYWSKGDFVVVQEETAAALLSTDTWSITYQGEFDIVAITANQNEIINNQTLEGTGTGIVEDVADEPENTSRDSAFDSGMAKIQKYAVEGKSLKFKTIRTGLKPGQLATVTLPEHNLNGDQLLIESVTTMDDSEKNIWYDITCSSGPEVCTWAKMFQAMATRGQAFIIRQNISETQVLITLQTFNKTWMVGTTSNIFKEIFPSVTQYPSVNTYPMFDYQDRCKYIELLDSVNTVLVRKAITKQTGANTSNILSTTFIAPFEGNGNIAKVRFYGGSTANDTPGSGILIDEQLYTRTKTQLEGIQIDKTDVKGW
jgi:hypothetical protein